MKKNVLMRAASGLLVATMLTTCAISGTFAKYVTQDNGGDMARVAKWGVVVQVEGDLYGQKYLNVDQAIGGNLATDVTSGNQTIGIDGKQTAPATVVAPGSESKSGLAFNISGTPEVDSRTTVKINAQNIYLAAGKYGVMVPVANGILTSENFNDIANAEGDDAGLYTRDGDGVYTKVTGVAEDTAPSGTYYTLEDYVVNTDTYYPVTYTLAGTNTSQADPDTATDNGPKVKNTDTLQVIAKTILDKVAAAGDDTSEEATWSYADARVYSATAVSGVVENNQDLRDIFGLKDTVLTWNWEFNDTKDEDQVHDGIDHHISQQDKLDTILGNLMAVRKDTKEGTKDFKGEVVKFDTASDSYKVPTVASNDDLKDYCLDTKFDICITVEQVD